MWAVLPSGVKPSGKIGSSEKLSCTGVNSSEGPGSSGFRGSSGKLIFDNSLSFSFLLYNNEER
jgi:hypothetical protein